MRILRYSGFETCFEPSTFGVWGFRKHISNRYVWHHVEQGSDGIYNVFTRPLKQLKIIMNVDLLVVGWHTRSEVAVGSADSKVTVKQASNAHPSQNVRRLYTSTYLYIV